MVGKYVRKTNRQSWDSDAMRRAIEAVQNQQMGWLKAAKTFNVPFTTLRRRATDANKRIKHSSKGLGRFHTTFTQEQEQQLVDHIKTLEKRLFGITCNELRTLVYDWVEANNIDHRFNKTSKQAGWDWIRGFRLRHPDLSLRKPENTSLARAMAFNKPVIAQFFKILQEIVDRYNITPDRMYNVDETGISTVQNPPKIFARKGKKQVGTIAGAERGLHVTGVCCTNAIGNYVPPALIFPRKNWKHELLEGAPNGSVGFPQESGWMTGEIFLKWLQHFEKFCRATVESPVLLILDGHVSHKNWSVLKYAKENGIILLCLPAHCSHRIQPLDVTFFAPLKAYLNQEITKKIRNNEGRPISQLQVAGIFRIAYEKAATVENATSGFRHTGLWPINPDVFPDHLYEPSNTTDTVNDANVEAVLTLLVEPATDEVLNVKNGVNTSVTDNKKGFVQLETLSPLPSTSRSETSKKRKKTPALLTSSPFMEEIKQKEHEKAEQARRRSARQVKKALKISEKDTFEEETAIEDEAFVGDSDDDDAFCLFCCEKFSKSRPGEHWIRCCNCKEWAHIFCADVSPKTKSYICDACA